VPDGFELVPTDRALLARTDLQDQIRVTGRVRCNWTSAAAVDHCLSVGLTNVGWHCLSNSAGSSAVAEEVGFVKERDRVACSSVLSIGNPGDLSVEEYLEWANTPSGSRCTVCGRAPTALYQVAALAFVPPCDRGGHRESGRVRAVWHHVRRLAIVYHTPLDFTGLY